MSHRRGRGGIRVAIISNGKSSASDGGSETHWPNCSLAARVGRRGRSRQLSQLKERGGRSCRANRGDGETRGVDSGQCREANGSRRIARGGGKGIRAAGYPRQQCGNVFFREI